ncbi:hypothetical protein Clacol_006385 [Clathrus columnatus]|uniref:Inosine/uridine-preferring nucleoside hydrolase domain-containing protein n=1 Tax=Clathrus columnatus TaxID=1419009 RepID=A0AAV5AHI8_9AGAM|nr:hypothetical protein Clacol_006385 [Clathrus columnatus]
MILTSKETSDAKRKGPPEFRHLPRDRAKKLKQQWIEKKKIKSQWKQEKKRQNIMITRPTSTEPQNDQNQAVSSNSTAKDSTGDSTGDSLLKMDSYKKLKRKEPKVVVETEKISEKVPQIDRTSTTSQRTITTNRKRQNTGFQSKKEIFTGKKQRRPVTMREKMGSLLEKIQKSHAQGHPTYTMCRESGYNKWACNTCPYEFPITKQMTSRTRLRRKQVDDVLGGEETWKDADQTEKQCDRCESNRAYYRQLQISLPVVEFTVFEGHDDAIAILLAITSDQLEILGISTVHGNASASNTWKNALRLLYAFGAPYGQPHVYPGASKPLLRPAKADVEIHGEDGLGGVEDLLPPFTDPRIQARAQRNHLHAIEAMASAIRKVWDGGHGKKTTLVTTGPQTNLALFLSVYPELQSAIEEIVFMGGALGIGNRSAVAEYNILCDPEASQIVLDFPVRKVMIPINVTHQVIYTEEIHCRLLEIQDTLGSSNFKASTPLRHFLSTLLTFFSQTYQTTFGFNNGPPLHDPLTIAYILHPEYFTCKRYRVDVERSGVFSTGATIVDVWNYRSCDDSWGHSGKNCLVVETVDRQYENNVQSYLSNKPNEQETASQASQVSVSSSEITPQSSVLSARSSPPPVAVPPPQAQGLIVPPFPKREQTKNPILRYFNSTMDAKEAQDAQQHIFDHLDDFDDAPPFTIQRLCELCLWPRKHYKTISKYLRAVERTILVTSTKAIYPDEEAEGQPALTSYPDSESVKLATTPVFSPIPFLHLDARRSRSPSPCELEATRHPGKQTSSQESKTASNQPKGLGLVDELDDPNPGHLADHPIALSAVTKIPPLSKRFVKAVDDDVVMQDSNNGEGESPSRPSAEDAEVEGMVVLDDSTPEEEKKEDGSDS